jgi:hypothetical protein
LGTLLADPVPEVLMTPAKWIALALLASPVAAQAEDPKPAEPTASAPDPAQIHDQMRKLWADHAWLLHSYIVSSCASLADTEAIRQRMLHNDQDIAQALQPYLGDGGTDRLTLLLANNRQVALDLVDAEKTKDGKRVSQLKSRWNADAQRVTQFLASADREDWVAPSAKDLFQAELAAVIDQTTARLDGRWDIEQTSVTRLEAASFAMADLLSGPIAAESSKRVADDSALE